MSPYFIAPMSHEGHTYAERNQILVRLGFQAYADYLKSPLWKSIRRRVLKNRPRCKRCGGSAGQVHHTDYRRETLAGEDLSGLVPICRNCHEAIEFDADGGKRSLIAANSQLGIKPQFPTASAVKPAAKSQTWQQRKKFTVRQKQKAKRAWEKVARRGWKNNKSRRSEPVAEWKVVDRKALIESGAVVCVECQCVRHSAKSTGICSTCRKRQAEKAASQPLDQAYASRLTSSCTDEPVRHTSGLDGRGAKTREIASTPAA